MRAARPLAWLMLAGTALMALAPACARADDPSTGVVIPEWRGYQASPNNDPNASPPGVFLPPQSLQPPQQMSRRFATKFYPKGALPLAMEPADLRALATITFKELPPPKYDHPTTDPVLVIDVWTEAELRQQCGWPPRRPEDGTMVGCVRKEGTYGGFFWIILLGPESDMKRNGVTRNVVLRHEVGHVNGWPADHPGMR